MIKNRLTHERCSGIKKGYWSPAKKDELIQSLAEYENRGFLPKEIDTIIKLYDNLVEERGWHLSEYELPKVNGEYIVAIVGAEIAAILNYDVEENSWYCEENGEKEYYRVDAWMHMPKVPLLLKTDD